MPSFSRRAFLGATLASLATGRLLGQDKTATPAPKLFDDAAFQPSTLLLTWQREPSTTMTVQWVGAAGETADTKVYYSEPPCDCWEAEPATTKPYPQTDLKVFRAELSGLSPGTDYQFRIGKHSPTYRFRTMPAKAT